MTSLNPQTLKAGATSRLSATARHSRRLVLIHTGVIMLLTFLTSCLNLYLEHQIGETGGLGGLGTRSVLQSLQTFLQYGTLIFTPFWYGGFVLVTLHWADGKPSDQTDLLSGFPRWSSIVVYQLLLFVLYFLAAMVCAYIASIIFSMTPAAESLLALLAPVLSGGTIDIAALDSIPMDALLQAYLPMLAIYLVILTPVLVFFSYSLRLSVYFIMDEPNVGGFAAMQASFRAMRGNRLKLLKLDLSFWWFYLLEGILLVICYLDLLLPLLGISLPFNSTVAYFVTLIVYCVLELLLHLWMKAQVDTTYALAYRAITAPPASTEIKF